MTIVGIVVDAILGLAVLVMLFVGWRWSRHLNVVLGVLEDLAIDAEDYARRNRHAIGNLRAGIELMLEAVRPDLAEEFRTLRKSDSVRPRHLEEIEKEEVPRG